MSAEETPKILFQLTGSIACFKACDLVSRLAKRGILGGVPVSRFYPEKRELANLMLVTATETNSDDDMAHLAAALGEVL